MIICVIFQSHMVRSYSTKSLSISHHIVRFSRYGHPTWGFVKFVNVSISSRNSKFEREDWKLIHHTCNFTWIRLIQSDLKIFYRILYAFIPLFYGRILSTKDESGRKIWPNMTHQIRNIIYDNFSTGSEWVSVIN